MKRKIQFEKGAIGWLQRYALLSYDHPILLFFGVLLTILFFGFLGASLGFDLTEASNEWEIKTNKHVKQNAAIDEALDELSAETVQAPYSVDEDELEVFLTYQAKDSGRNMFTQENLETQRRVENEVMSGSYAEVCLRNYSAVPLVPEDELEEGEVSVPCNQPLSVLMNFFVYSVDPPMFGDWLLVEDDMTDQQRVNAIERSIEAGLDTIRENLFVNAFFLDTDYSSTGDGEEKTEYTRSRFQLGLPIVYSRFEKGREKLERGEEVTIFTNSKTDEEEQIDKIYDEYLEPLESELFDLLGMKAPTPLKTEYSDFGELDNLEVLFWNIELQNREMARVALADFMWAGLSILSVWLYMLVHLGSVFLSLIGILEIFFSFPVALFFYKPLFRVEYFSEMNLLVIFILLGIGADDIFVFTDAYKQSGSVPGVDPSLQGRLMYSTSRASKAIFVTSFTTMAAFFATAVSPLMPMQAFGIFAALCIIFLFIINLLLMPPALVLYAGYTPYMTRYLCPCCVPEHRPQWVNTYCPCCTCCHVEIDETFFLPLAESVEKAGHGSPSSPPVEMEMTHSHSAGGPNAVPNQLPLDGSPQNDRPIVLRRQSSLADASVHELRAVEKFFYGPFFIFLQRAKYGILAVGVVLFCVGIGLITTFKTPDEAEVWFPEDHAFNRFQDYFDVTSTPFMNSVEDSVAEVRLVWGLKGMDPSSRDIWVGDDYGDLEYDTSFNVTYRESQEFLLRVCPIVRERTCDADLCEPKYLIRMDRTVGPDAPLQQPCWIEDFNTWLMETHGEEIPIAPNSVFRRLRQFLNVETFRVAYGEDIGLSEVNQNIRFVLFRFDSTFRPPAASNKVKKLTDEWEDLIDELNEMATAENALGVNNGFESSVAWLWPSTSDALIQGAISGLLLVFVLAFVVLNLASGNLVISCIAVATIAGIVATVMGIGIRGIMQWDLGTAESITIVILIGFSMDYTLHLSDSYMESPHSNRIDRTRDAMTHLGISVTAGAFTTLISALFLWATVLVFFQKFAFNVTATVFTSFVFSIFFFPALCLTVGPQGEWGNWSHMFGRCRKKQEVDWQDRSPDATQ